VLEEMVEEMWLRRKKMNRLVREVAALLRPNGFCKMTVLLLAIVASGRSARADTVLINDLADTVTMSLNGNVVTTCPPGLNGFEDCVLSPIFSGSGTISSLPNGSANLYIDDGNGHVSDVLAISAGPVFTKSNSTFQAVGVEFVSDPDPGFADLCSNHPGGCALTETGSSQLAMTINWTGGTTLAVSFESDLDRPPVPEPSTLFLVPTALIVGFSIARRRSEKV
jgi:hypothetical protein